MVAEIVHKDPDAIIERQFNWGAEWLLGDTIVTSTWIVPAGLTQVSAANTATTATIRLSGGTLGSSYLVVNRIVTASGLQQDESFQVTITQR